MIKSPGKLLSIAVAITVAAAFFVTAHVSSSAHPSYASLPTLRFTHFEANKGRLARTLDPALVSLANDADTISMTNANLVYIGVDNKVHLDLAKGYKVSKNHKVYTFTIKPNARYANGHKVQAGDFVFAIKRALAPSTASDVASTYLGAIKGADAFNKGKGTSIGVKALNSRTVQFTLAKPYAYFLKTLTYPTADALDPKVLAGKTAAATGNYLTSNCPANVGAGPFKFQCVGNDFFSGTATKQYTLVPNKYYYGHKPKIKVVMTAYDTLDTGYKAFQSGELDVTGVPSTLINQAKKTKQYLEWSTSRVYYFTPNHHMAPMNDVHCRLAVAYAINRNLISTKILHNFVKPIYQVVPPGFQGSYSGSDSPHFSVAKAKAEFAKCASKSTPLKLTYPTGTADNDNQYNEVANELRAVGFNASTNALSGNDWGNVVSQGLDKTHTQLTQNGWQQDYPDPQDYVSVLLRCGNDYDIGYFCNSKFDKLVDGADIQGNAKKRAAMYIQAQKIAIHDGAWITYQFARGHANVKPYVHGLVGTVAYANLQPVNYDWSKVSISKH